MEDPVERRRGIGMLGKRWGAPRWSDDPVQRLDRRWKYIEQEVGSPLEGSLMAGGLGRGYRKIAA